MYCTVGRQYNIYTVLYCWQAIQHIQCSVLLAGNTTYTVYCTVGRQYNIYGVLYCWQAIQHIWCIVLLAGNTTYTVYCTVGRQYNIMVYCTVGRQYNIYTVLYCWQAIQHIHYYVKPIRISNKRMCAVRMQLNVHKYILIVCIYICHVTRTVIPMSL